MPTGTFPITPSALIDRELRCQGTSLDTWAKRHGIQTYVLAAILDGEQPDATGLIDELAATLGVSTGVLSDSRINNTNVTCGRLSA